MLFTSFIGYVTHEAVVWSDVHDRWFFLPRRCSKESYNDMLDETRGCNVMITADDAFTNIKVCCYLNRVLKVFNCRNSEFNLFQSFTFHAMNYFGTGK
jgi:hypothetical protein